ncbi:MULTISPECIES: MDR family MFS transporter [Paenibacillus]|uniref:MFS family arabinose efflux permease n=1 Tax=Paenibacillus pabuli TaxID=1472 RepID=A0A855XTI4_9BACL|nr:MULTISPECIES: MFS transporter [Paenibacillus]PWW36784.1 putative MFS family arabinose efflux permease [Paenibacillus pabuli]PXW04109.1 putative MFS family arabinose efflux permease [Paenibacillus taichungensis]RAJ00588.1 putative MFS family arabinose efflux permease [Paenibacillus pabuli]
MKQHLRQIHPLAWTIIVGTMFGRLVTSMSIPFLSIYLTQVLGATPTQTGITVAVSSLAGVMVSFYGGYISDRIGRKVVMMVSVFGWACVFFIFSAAEHLWVFFVANTLNGLCRAVFEPTSRALLSDITPPQNKLLVFNLRYAAINLGVVFGPIIGLQLGSAESTFPFMISGLVYIFYGLVLFLQFRLQRANLPEHVQVTAPRLRDALATTGRDRVFLPVLIGTTFCVLGYGHFSSTLAQYVAQNPLFEHGSQVFSYMLSLNALTVLVIQFPIVRVASKFPPVVPLILGNLLVATSLFLFGIAEGVMLLMISVILFTIGEVLMFTMMDVLIDRIAKPEWKGTYFGTIGFNNLGSVMAPILGGLLLTQYGTGNGLFVFVPLALTTALGLPFLIVAHKRLVVREKETTLIHVSA